MVGIAASGARRDKAQSHARADKNLGHNMVQAMPDQSVPLEPSPWNRAEERRIDGLSDK